MSTELAEGQVRQPKLSSEQLRLVEVLVWISSISRTYQAVLYLSVELFKHSGLLIGVYRACYATCTSYISNKTYSIRMTKLGTSSDLSETKSG